MTTKAKQAARAEAIESLRGIITPGATIHTVVRHVSASGMSRSIDAYLLECGDGGKVVKHWLSRRAAAALEWPFDERREAVKVSGAGMDMGFHLVHSLASVLFRGQQVPCTGERCPSNDHSNNPREKYTTHEGGGYSLRQEWL